MCRPGTLGLVLPSVAAQHCIVNSVVLPRTAAQVLMCPDGTFKTHTSLCHNLNQAALDCLIFGQRKQNIPGLMQFANRKPPGTTLHRETHITHKPAFVGQLMLGYIVYFQVVKKLAADSHIQTEICTGRMEFLWQSVYL